MSDFDSSLSDWPTPTVTDGNRRDYTLEDGDPAKPAPSLGGLSKQNWPTPTANPEAPNNSKNRGGGRMSNRHTSQNLSEIARQNWPTPRAEDSEQTGRSAERRANSPPDNLPEIIRQWPTPDAGLSNDGESPESWLERKAFHATKEENPTHAGMPLSIAAQMYPTPAARDAKGANSKEHVTTTGTGRMHMDQLPNFVEHSLPSFSHPGPATSTDGTGSSVSMRRLNPRFVEWLMGWPIGWTDSEQPVTGFTQYKRLWRSYLFGRSF